MKTETKHALVIYNPLSGSAIDVDLCLGAIVQTLCQKLDYIVTIRRMEPDLSGTEILATTQNSVDLIVAAGGDGTIRAALGAIYDSGLQIPVGIIPLGTGNQLARNLKIYEEGLLTDPLQDALNVIARGVPKKIDLGKMNGHYFCVAAGAGPLSDAVVSPSPEEKKNLKILAYVGSIIQQFAMPPVVFRIKADSHEFEVSASGVFITNVADLGVGALSDTADVNDGLLDLCILNPSEFTDYLQMGFHVAGALFGGEAPYYIRKVTSVDVQVVPVESPLSDLQSIAHNIRSALKGRADKPPVYQEVTAMIDGDACGTTPMHIEVVPHAVNVLTPPVK